MKHLRFGIIGGGMMGKEFASAIARWFTLQNIPITVELAGVCSNTETTLSWFRQLPTVKIFTTDYKDLLNSPHIDAIYVAVPHDLHEPIYTDVLQSGKDLLAEKPFGINKKAAKRILQAAQKSGSFVRCSSEFPFYPGAIQLYNYVKAGKLGRLIEVKAGFLHASDLNPNKPINWKRQSQFCGEIGVMGDLGAHIFHLPLRLGLYPKNIFAILQKIYTERPDGKGGMAVSDTWNNATLLTHTTDGNENVPMTFELKRLSPGSTNTWYLELLGTDGGVRYSTRDTKTIWEFKREPDQNWHRIDLGNHTQSPTITGKIFEVGFSDIFLQMITSFVLEREGLLGDKLGCLTPEEALHIHSIFEAALQSNRSMQSIAIDYSISED